MNRKSIISGVLTAVFLVGIAAAPAAAGSRQRGRWEGFALGFGAAVLGHTLLQHHHPTAHYRAPVDRHPPRGYHHRRHGHWKFERVWVPPAFKKVWKPGHCGHRGRWVPGHWIKVQVSRGHWDKRKVWAAGTKRPGRHR